MKKEDVFTVEKQNGINILTLKKELQDAILEASVYPPTAHLHDDIGEILKAFLLEHKEEIILVVPVELDLKTEIGNATAEYFLDILGQIQRKYQDVRKNFFAIVFERKNSFYLEATYLATDCFFFQTVDEAIAYQLIKRNNLNLNRYDK